MSSGVLVPCDGVLPGGLVGGHGPVEDGAGVVAVPGDVKECGCERDDQVPDGGAEVGDVTVELGYLGGHVGERAADVGAEPCSAGHGRQSGEVPGPGEVCRGVAKPQV